MKGGWFRDNNHCINPSVFARGRCDREGAATISANDLLAAAGLSAIRSDVWGADVHRPLAVASHGGIEVAAFAVHDAGSVAEHSHEFHEILMPLASPIPQTIEWKSGCYSAFVAVNVGTVLATAAGQKHAARWSAGWMRLGVKIDSQWLQRYAVSTLGAGPSVTLSENGVPVCDNVLVSSAQRLLVLSAAESESEAELMRFVHHVLVRHGTGLSRVRKPERALTGARLKTACEALAGPPASLAVIARSLDLSPWSFSRAFRSATGNSPLRWAARQRVARAQALLARDPQLTIVEIAKTVGFGSERQLQRWCHAILQRSPGTLR